MEDKDDFIDPTIAKLMAFLESGNGMQEKHMLLSLYGDIIKNTNFFQGILEPIIEFSQFIASIAAEAKYEKHPVGSILMEEGQKPEKLYIILKGMSKVFIPQNGTKMDIKLEELTKEAEEVDSPPYIPRQKLRQATLMFSTRTGVLSTGMKGHTAGAELESRKLETKENDMRNGNVAENEGFEKPALKPVRKLLRAKTQFLKKDEALLMNVVFHQREKKAKYFDNDNNPKFKCIGKLKVGDFFGDNIINNNSLNNMSVIASEELHTLSISRQALHSVLTTMREKAKERIKTGKLLVPINMELEMGEMMIHFKEKVYEKDEVIYLEGSQADSLMILHSGIVKFFKRVIKRQRSIAKELKHEGFEFKTTAFVGEIHTSELFGDEILIAQSTRYTKAVAGAEGTVCYFLEIDRYNQIKEKYAEVISYLQNIAKQNYSKRMNVVAEDIRIRSSHRKSTSMNSLPSLTSLDNEASPKSPIRDKDPTPSNRRGFIKENFQQPVLKPRIAPISEDQEFHDDTGVIYSVKIQTTEPYKSRAGSNGTNKFTESISRQSLASIQFTSHENSILQQVSPSNRLPRPLTQHGKKNSKEPIIIHKRVLSGSQTTKHKDQQFFPSSSTFEKIGKKVSSMTHIPMQSSYTPSNRTSIDFFFKQSPKSINPTAEKRTNQMKNFQLKPYSLGAIEDFNTDKESLQNLIATKFTLKADIRSLMAQRPNQSLSPTKYLGKRKMFNKNTK